MSAKPSKKIDDQAVPINVVPTELDKLIHERLRLGIMSALSVNDWLSFNQLKKLLKTTDGNLSVHARKLEDANYITCKKYIHDRMPKTEYALTKKGRKLFNEYLQQMDEIVKSMKKV